MSAIGWVIVGACAVSVLWLMACAWLVDVIAAQRKALSDSALTVRLYRDHLSESDRQVRALLSQSERLARQLIEAKAIAPATTYTVAVPPSFFQAREES